MSLAIDVDKVKGVLLSDGWYEVKDRSFVLDSYEYLWWPEGADGAKIEEPDVVHGGGQSGVCATGFTFKGNEGDWISGPLTAIEAVRY